MLAIGAGGGKFTFAAISQVSSDPVRSVTLEGVGHYAALEAPDQVARALLEFFSTVDATIIPAAGMAASFSPPSDQERGRGRISEYFNGRRRRP